jgi:hypothetical protein
MSFNIATALPGFIGFTEAHVLVTSSTIRKIRFEILPTELFRVVSSSSQAK